jgi:2'-5' RNA ligase
MQPETRGYSIWLHPGKTREDLSHLITMIAGRLGTPAFPPHITLAGEVDADPEKLGKQISWIASVTDPFKVRSDKFGYQKESFFKAFYFEIEPGKRLLDLRKLAAKALHIPVRPYLPHISLVYGHPGDEARKKLITELGNWLPLTVEITRISLRKTDGPVSAWSLIKEFELGN